MTLTLKINRQARDVEAQPFDTLLHVLREKLSLTGAKRGCNQGVCGACTVLVDGRPVRSCLSIASNCVDREITTIEGLSADGAPSALQQSFLDHGAVQCGFCTPGMIVSAHALLAGNPKPSTDEVRAGLAGNLCRCSGYRKIVDAVRGAARRGAARRGAAGK
ncbi:MAG TPA: (2Fe-2S)-binding protein [Thermohalobaculum sp.]|nr:(2Fe-2S)-binding protein [Thermohalobaculum sp.]